MRVPQGSQSPSSEQQSAPACIAALSFLVIYQCVCLASRLLHALYHVVKPAMPDSMALLGMQLSLLYFEQLQATSTHAVHLSPVRYKRTTTGMPIRIA